LKGEEELDASEVAAGWGVGRQTIHAHYVPRRALDHVDVVVGPLRLRRRFFRRSDVEAFQHTPRGTNPESLRALFSTHIGPIRQKALGRLFGAKAGRLGGRPRGYTEQQAQRALELMRRPGTKLSDEAVGRIVGLSRRQVQHLRAKAAQNPF
jgi:hypothetical protein